MAGCRGYLVWGLQHHHIWHLTHLPQVMHICISESGQHWFRQWLVAYSAPSHYLNQCWVIVNWTPGDKFQWNFNQNTKLFIHEIASENVVCERVAILSRGRWVNDYPCSVSCIHLPSNLWCKHKPTIPSVTACCLIIIKMLCKDCDQTSSGTYVLCLSLTHWGRVTHICVSKLTIFGSDNGLSPGRHQAIIWTNAGLLLIGPLGTYFSEILIEILTFSFKKMRVKVSSAKRWPFCLGPNVLKQNQKKVILQEIFWELFLWYVS